MKRVFLIYLLLASFIAPVQAKVVQLDVYRSWYGSNSEYKSSKPFFMIYDNYELESFWKKCGSDEAMPWIDFNKCMLFVWNPGPTLHSCAKTAVTDFLFKDNKYIILMNFVKKYCGGGWKHPFLATLLPKVKKGDIFVMKTDSSKFGEVRWIPIFTMWDMQQEREAPFEMVSQDMKPKRNQFIKHKREPVRVAKVKTAKPVVHKTKPTVIAKTNVKKNEKKSSLAKETRNQSYNKPVNKPVNKVKTKLSAKNKKIYDEDIFGQEFDINF